MIELTITTAFFLCLGYHGKYCGRAFIGDNIINNVLFSEVKAIANFLWLFQIKSPQKVLFQVIARKIADILEIQLSTLYYHSVNAEQDMSLAEMIKDIAFKYTFYGYRRIHLAVNRRGV